MLPFSTSKKQKREEGGNPCSTSIVVQDFLIAVDGHVSNQEFFIFSPFGLCCRQCNKCIQLDERCIRDHLKKHVMDSRVATVCSILKGYVSQRDKAKLLGNIDPYRSDKNTYIGHSCVCGSSFIKKGNAIRHCKTIGCDPSKLQNVELIKLCCGRYVTEAQVTSFFTDAPRLSQQFDYHLTRATLLP